MNILRRFINQVFTPQKVEATPENVAKWEKKAPGWTIRCNRCGLEEPFGKYGILYKSAGRKRNFARCPRCRKWSWLVIWKHGNTPDQQRDSKNPSTNHSFL
ncbi:MAG: hypothetical protein ACLTNK_01960 [Akkermansia muciniphila]